MNFKSDSILSYLLFASILILLIILKSPINDRVEFYPPLLVGLYAVLNGFKAVKTGKFTYYERIGLFSNLLRRREQEGNFARAAGVLKIFVGGLFITLALKLFQIL